MSGGDPDGWATTWMDERVVSDERGGKVFVCKVDDHIMELVTMSRDEASLLSIQGMTYGECRIVSITVGREVWGIYTVP